VIGVHTGRHITFVAHAQVIWEKTKMLFVGMAVRLCIPVLLVHNHPYPCTSGVIRLVRAFEPFSGACVRCGPGSSIEVVR